MSSSVIEASGITLETGEVQGLKAGSTEGKEKWGTVAVKNGEGKARSHITLQGKWNVPPEVLFHIFTYPDNTKLFRDVSRVGQRNIVVSQPGLKVIEVEQHQNLKVLWVNRTFTTWLKVTEDTRDKECLSVQFDLMRSDVLAHFEGRWEIRPVKDSSGKVVGCEAELNQDVLPKGVPSIMQHVPLLGELLRGVCMRAIRRVMEDLDKAVNKIRAGMEKGRAPLDVLRDLCGTCNEQGHANGAVASFEVNDMDDDDGSSQASANRTSGGGTPITGNGVHTPVSTEEAALRDAEIRAAMEAAHLIDPLPASPAAQANGHIAAK